MSARIRAVEEKIDLAEFVGRFLDHPCDLGFGRDVGLDTDRLGPGFLGQLARRVFDPVAVDIDDGNLDAFARQVTGAGIAHSTGAPGDQRRAAFLEQIHASSILFLWAGQIKPPASHPRFRVNAKTKSRRFR